MIELFHGSTSPIEKPLVSIGRPDLDFGQGFYLTRHKEQAERWATRVQLIRRDPEAWISTYVLDMDLIVAKGFPILHFETYDREWLHFIVKSRKGEEPWRGYDLIEGGVANDRVIDTVEDFIEGIITEKQALGKLVYTAPNHQICLLNQELIDSCLYFQEATKLK